MRTLVVTLLLVLLPAGAYAHELKIGNLVIVHPMVDQATKGEASAKGSVKIRNEGKTPDQLLSISAEFAGIAKIDAPVPVPIPANGQSVSILLAFGNITVTLSEDEAYAGEMVFEKAGSVMVEFIVHTHAH